MVVEHTSRQSLDSISMTMTKQEAQLMLTNLHDVFSGQSRSPNMVPFDMLGMVSY